MFHAINNEKFEAMKKLATGLMNIYYYYNINHILSTMIRVAHFWMGYLIFHTFNHF